MTVTEYTDDGVKRRSCGGSYYPPVMKGSDDANADFKKRETEQGGRKYVEYVAPYGRKIMLVDINKTFSQDTYLCFSATVTNRASLVDGSDQIILTPDDVSGFAKAEEIKELQNSPKGQHDSNTYNRFVDQ